MLPAQKNDYHQLSSLLKSRRGQKGLRGVAAEIGGVSASTLSRVEQGGVPDLATYLRLCQWLEVSSDDLSPLNEDRSLLAGRSANAMPTPELMEAHFRAEKVLPPETIDALSNMIRQAYKWAVTQNYGKELPAKHEEGI